MALKKANANIANEAELTQVDINAIHDKLALYSKTILFTKLESVSVVQSINTANAFFLENPAGTFFKILNYDGSSSVPVSIELHRLKTSSANVPKLVSGNFGTGGQAITANHLEFIIKRKVNEYDLLETTPVILDYGDIGATTVIAHINALDPGVEIVATATNLTIIKSIVNDSPESYIYVGDLETYGVNDNEITANELEVLEVSNDLIEASTGLEALDEGNGIGWRLKGRDPDKYLNIGFGSLDFSDVLDFSELYGASGSYAICIGLDNIVSGFASGVIGYLNKVLSHYSFATGRLNIVDGMYSFASGIGNKIIKSDYSFASGHINEINANYGQAFGRANKIEAEKSLAIGENNVCQGVASSAIGVKNKTRAGGEVVVGVNSYDVTPMSATSNDIRDLAFHIGTAFIHGPRLSQFMVFKSGLIKFRPIDVKNSVFNPNIPGGITGMFGLDNQNANRPTIHNGEAWKGLAYKDELQQKTYENLITTGIINIDVSLYSSIKLHLTGNTVINFINTPTDQETKAITMAVTTADGTQSLGLPSANNYHYSGNFQADERNKFAMEFAHYNASGLEVDVFINQFN